MFKKRGFTGIILLSLFISSVLLAGGCTFQPQRTVDATPYLEVAPEPRIRIREVETGTVTDTVQGLAQVVSGRIEPLYFTEGGIVEEILVRQNEFVEEGQALARLERENLAFEYRLAEMDLRQLELHLNRARALAANNEISNYELRMRELDYERQQLHLQQLENRMEGAIIRAPFDGIITSLSLRRARRVQPYQDVITIADPTNLQLRMEVSPSVLWNLAPGLRAEARVDGGPRFEAIVSRVPSLSAEFRPGIQDRRVYLSIPNLEEVLGENTPPPAQILSSNILVRVEIIVNQREALLIPQSAIRRHGSREFVFIRDGNLIREADIETGTELRNRVEVITGLSEDDLLVIR